MNILIVGEFSAFAKHLKNGFVANGHHANIVTYGDGFKKLDGDKDDVKYSIQRDYVIFGKKIKKSHYFRNPLENKRLKAKLCRLPNPDLILIVNPTFVSAYFFQLGVSLKYLQKCKYNGAKIIMSCCGDDPSAQYYPELKYCYDKYPKGPASSNRREILRFNSLLKLADVIVPIGYDYKYSVKRYCEDRNINTPISNSIPLPITITPTEISSCVGRKIVIFHGIIREQFKGTKYFVEALNRIKEKYPDKVETIVDGKMPYDKYIDVLKRMDILLDQTNSYGTGINAELGLMMGKLVFSGNEPENEKDMNIEDVPVINAIPDADYIFNKLDEYISSPSKIDYIKIESRRFAEEHLDAKIIAKRYLNFFNIQ